LIFVRASPAPRAPAGTLHVEIDAVYPFTQAQQALADFTSRHVRDKIVVTF
jgi:NADPH:quinone reductase-like Zn-dependent oxidoreductase